MAGIRHLSSLLIFAVALPAFAQDLPSHPKDSATVCVATVTNLSPRSAMLDRLTQRLAKDLSEEKIRALAMESTTTTDSKLHPTRENGEEARSKDCDYILLTQIVDPKTRPLEAHSPQISIGGKVPSTDASDPLGGSSGPVYRENLQIGFAVFPIERVKPMLDTVILARPSGSATDNLLSAMDQESNRVGHEFKKK